MRVVKDAQERKNEILDVAEELFATNGFDQTSTNDILARVGIARGTLYYHFKSKEDILDAIIERIVRRLMANASLVASDTTIPVLDRVTLAVAALNVDTSIGNEVMVQVHNPQNALMHQKLQESLIGGIVPILSKLVEEGIKEGILNTNYPDEAVEMIMLYSNIAFDDLMEQTPDKMQRRIEAFICNTERILGAEPGSMKDAIMNIFLRQK